VVVGYLSPNRWAAALAARMAAAGSAGSWLAMSVAPAATMQRLLDVAPAMAAFVAAYEMGRRLSRRIWWLAAPIVVIASLESILGILQYYLLRLESSGLPMATGTYVNRNHFAGLLEMALPLAIAWAIASWRRGNSRSQNPGGPTLRTALLLAVAAFLFMGMLASLSRMGILSTLVGLGAMGAAWLFTQQADAVNPQRRWRWMAPAGVLVGVLMFLAFLSPGEMVQRFAEFAQTEDLTSDGRVQIWKDTVKLIVAYPLTGCGLGAYERGLFAFKTVAPMNTVDFAHNDYLQILAELGFPGFLLVTAVGGWILWSTLSAVIYRRGRSNWELAVGLLGVFVAIGLHSLADFNLYIPANALALAWLAGLAVSPAVRGEP
jgi:O-antigen ligase